MKTIYKYLFILPLICSFMACGAEDPIDNGGNNGGDGTENPDGGNNGDNGDNGGDNGGDINLPWEPDAPVAEFKKIIQPDETTPIKNPYMGWSLYLEGNKGKMTPRLFWASVEDAIPYSNVLYIRWPWRYFEPEEGKYAWEYDNDFKNFVQGALDRGMRLAFRVFISSRDQAGGKHACPDYVINGSQCYEEENPTNPRLKTPYANDEHFLKCYTKFIAEFGKVFNDPSKVDYIDCSGLGWWGEEHHVWWNNNSKKEESYRRIAEAYTKAFDKVIVVTNYAAPDKAGNVDNMYFNDYGMAPRRDGYVSSHFPPTQQQGLKAFFPKNIIIAEACYWQGGNFNHPDTGVSTWGDYYRKVVNQAIDTHANYLDLRTPTEAKLYLEQAPDAVEKFVEKGGYRIYPDKVSAKVEGSNISVSHSWMNLGVGVLPNNNKYIGYKYKVAFALFNNKLEIVQQWNSDKVEVSNLVGNNGISASDVFDAAKVPAGDYMLGVGIVNTRENDSKDITLAVKDAKIIKNEWVYLGSLSVNK